MKLNCKTAPKILFILFMCTISVSAQAQFKQSVKNEAFKQVRTHNITSHYKNNTRASLRLIEDSTYTYNGGVLINKGNSIYKYNDNNYGIDPTNDAFDLTDGLSLIKDVAYLNAASQPQHVSDTTINNNPWGSASKESRLFDANHRTIELYYEYGNNIASLILNNKTTLTLNSNGLISEELIQDWNSVGSVFENSYKTTYQYNSANLVSHIYYLNWNVTTSAWDSTNIYELTYNNNHLSATLDLYRNSANTAWDNSLKVEYTYNGNNLITEISFFEYVASAWSVYEKETFQYNSSNQLSHIEVLGVLTSNGPLLSFSQGFITYPNTAAEYPNTIYYQDWNGSAYDSTSKVYYTYISGNGPIESTNWEYRNGALWEQGDIYKYFYDSFIPLSISTVKNKNTTIQLYPNPCTTTIQVTEPLNLNSYEIYTTHGQKVLTGKLGQKEIEVGALLPGQYIFIALDKAQNIYTSKIIKE